jgi:hypothetical protein
MSFRVASNPADVGAVYKIHIHPIDYIMHVNIPRDYKKSKAVPVLNYLSITP